MTDEEIVLYLRRHEERVITKLFDNYFKLSWTVAAGILGEIGTREDIEECVEDVFLTLWERPEQFEPSRGSIKNYICLLTKSRALDRFRKLRRWSCCPLEEAETELNEEPFEQAVTKEQVKRAVAFIERFEEPDRSILLLRLFYGLRPAEVAERLRLPIRVIYEKLRRGKERLKEVLR